jgi:hypothetical protein
MESNKKLKNDNELYCFLRTNSMNGIGKNVFNNFIKKFDWYAYNQFEADNNIVLSDFYEYYRNYY